MTYYGKKKNNKRPFNPNERDACCDTCQSAQYVGAGDVWCDKHEVFIRTEWNVTDDFLKCLGKDYRQL